MKKKITRITMAIVLGLSLSLSTACAEKALVTDSTTIATTTSEITDATTETVDATTAETTATLPGQTKLSIPATYFANFETVRLYADASRTTIKSVLTKGELVTITGTSENYGVTEEGYFVNLNLMTIVVAVTPTPTPTTVATTAEPVATTKAPAATTKAPAATTVATTAAPPVETAPPVVTTAAPATDYTAVCADIRSKLIANLEANGKWDPNFAGEVRGWGQKWWAVGWYDDGDMTTQGFADEYYNGKFAGTEKIACGIDCYVSDGKIYLDYRAY